jgi:outer membrane protein OmpA-like peptidoglycan-associated protein
VRPDPIAVLLRLIAVLVLLLFCPAHTEAQAYGPDTPVPPGATLTIEDLRFRIEPLAGTVQDLDLRETPTEIRIALAADVLFDFDKADLRPDAVSVLTQAAEIIGARGRRGIVIEGHTDARGAIDYNLRLSEHRAETVKRWFQQQPQLAGVSMRTRGWGPSKPAAPNTKPDGSDDPEGRQKNRRVEIVIAKGTSQ